MCVLKLLFGIPCFTCGITRSVLSFLDLELKIAFIYHPLSPLILIYILFGILHILKIRLLSKYEVNAVVSLLFIVYVVRMFLFFPNTPPMDYEPNNLVYFILKNILGVI